MTRRLYADLPMNEVTGAVGLGQVQRVTGYVQQYTRSLGRSTRPSPAAPGCAGAHVPAGAGQVGYIWACVWEGDRHGLRAGPLQAGLL